jgi:hypothetical protein
MIRGATKPTTESGPAAVSADLKAPDACHWRLRPLVTSLNIFDEILVIARKVELVPGKA